MTAVFVLKLWGANLRVPFDYGGDALLFSFIVKTVADHGWCWTNPSVGAPSGFQMNDYAVSAHDSFHLLAIKAMSVFSNDWALLFNLYFLLGFPLITLSAMAVFRRFRVGYLPALVGGVLYSFLPSRLLKGEGHLFLDTFLQVPLAVLLMLRVCSDEPPLTHARECRWPRIDLRSTRAIGTLLICGLIASTSAYYAFFSICLLLVIGVCASLHTGSSRSVISAVVLVVAIAVGGGLNGLPKIAYQARHGVNNEVGQRSSWEAEIYGMKVSQLLLPVSGHRLAALRKVKRDYDQTAPLNGETGSTSLGVVGALGFIVLLASALSTRTAGPVASDPLASSTIRSSALRWLGPLTVAAVLLGTIGGLGSLFAFLISPQIRTYSRLNVFIGFFSLFAVVLILDRHAARRPTLMRLASLVVLVVGLFDQASLFAPRPYAVTKTQFSSDEDLVRRMEQVLPSTTAVFELPFSPFPEPPDMHNMSGYEPVRAYLHSRHLRWSYPTMRGRGADAWVRDTSQREPAAMLNSVSDAEFGGILIDRNGYGDRAAALEADLRRLLGADPLVSAAENLSFFSLLEYNGRRHAGESPVERERRQYLGEHPIGMTWGDGFWGVENEPNKTFRWSRADSELRIDNDSSLTRRISVGMTLAAARPPAHWRVDGGLLSEAVELTDDGMRLASTFDVPPGQHTLQFRCNGRRADAPADPRTLVWRAENFAFDEIRATTTALPIHPAGRGFP